MPWAARGYHGRPQHLSELLQQIMKSSIQTRYWGKKRYQDGQIMDLVGQITFRFLKWPKIFISHNTKGIYNLLPESALVLHHPCTSCSCVMQYVGVS